MPRFNFSPEECKQIREEYEQGATIAELSAKWKTLYTTIARTIVKTGGTLRKNNPHI